MRSKAPSAGARPRKATLFIVDSSRDNTRASRPREACSQGEFTREQVPVPTLCPPSGSLSQPLTRRPRGSRSPHESRGGEDPEEEEDGSGKDCGEGSAHGNRPKKEEESPQDPDVAEPAGKGPSPDCGKPVHGEAGGEHQEAEHLDGAEPDDGLCDDDGHRLRNSSRRVWTREHIEGDCLADEHHRRNDESNEPHDGCAADQEAVLSVERVP